MRAVGQLDEDNADVMGHGHDHLAEVLGLRFFAVAELQLVQLGDTIYQFGHGRAKATVEIVFGDIGIFDDIVEEGSHQGFVIEAHFGQDTGNGYRVDDVRFATGASLPFVGITRNEISLPECLDLRLRQVFDRDFFQAIKKIQFARFPELTVVAGNSANSC